MKQRITIDHVGIAAMSLDEGSRFWELIGLVRQGADDIIEDQGDNSIFPTFKHDRRCHKCRNS